MIYEVKMFGDQEPGDKPVPISTVDAPGAIPKGTRVRKINSLPGDNFPDGTLGTVGGSISVEDLFVTSGVQFMYCVYWDSIPGVPIHIFNERIERVDLS